MGQKAQSNYDWKFPYEKRIRLGSDWKFPINRGGGQGGGGETNQPVNFHMKMGVGSGSKGPTDTISEACAVRGEN